MRRGPVVPPRLGQPKTHRSRAVRGKDAQKDYGPFAVAPGTHARCHDRTVTGATGDPDLYVRFGSKPSVTDVQIAGRIWWGRTKACSLTFPKTAISAFVMVQGYEAGTTICASRTCPRSRRSRTRRRQRARGIHAAGPSLWCTETTPVSSDEVTHAECASGGWRYGGGGR